MNFKKLKICNFLYIILKKVFDLDSDISLYSTKLQSNSNKAIPGYFIFELKHGITMNVLL